MDFFEVLAYGAVGFLAGVFTVTYAFWKLEKLTFIEDSLASFLDSLANNEEYQKFLYQIGGIIGAGVKDGVGLDMAPKSRGGRFKWQDMALELATQFIAKSISNPSPSPGPLTTPTPQNILTQKQTDKW